MPGILWVHRASGDRKWIKAQKGRVELFFLPAYRPDLTPDEFLNNDTTANAVKILVNSTANGTGDAQIAGNILAGTTGSGTITIDATNGAAVGGSITRSAGTLTANTVALTASGTAKGIGAATSGQEVATTASIVTASAGTGGIYITEADGASFTATVAGATGDIALTSNEYNTARRLRKDYWLYVVFHCATPNPSLNILNDPSTLDWQPIVKVEHYRLRQDSVKRPVELKEDAPPYQAGGNP